MERLKVEYVSTGIGNNFGNVIELNENLKKYPELHDKVLKHELSHTDKLFSKKDFIIDISESEINQFDMLKFMFKHPKSFTQLFPFYFSRKHGFVYDINLCIIYSFLMLLFLIAFLMV